MKNVILLSVIFTLLSTSLFSQVIGGNELKDIPADILYLEMKFTFGGKFAKVDYGQKKRGTKTTYVCFPDGRKWKFNSEADVFETFRKAGYDFHREDFKRTTNMGHGITRYVLKRNRKGE